jgi:hypothetical protein
MNAKKHESKNRQKKKIGFAFIAFFRGDFGLRRAALQKIKRVAKREKHSFQSCKDGKKTIVDAEEQSIVETPFTRRGTRLHGAIEAARRHHKKVQQQAIKSDPENYPEERANAGE